MVFSITNDRVPHGRELCSDLILQSRLQLNPNKRRIGKKAFDGITKFGTSSLRISRRSQLLKDSFTSKIVYERARWSVESPAHYREIVPCWSMVEKLFYQRVAILIGLSKQQNAGNKTIDSMND